MSHTQKQLPLHKEDFSQFHVTEFFFYISRYTISGANLDQDIPTEKISNELLPAVTTPSR